MDRFEESIITESICRHWCELYGFIISLNPRNPIEKYNEDFIAIWPDGSQSFIEVKGALFIERCAYYYYLKHNTFIFIVSEKNIFYTHIKNIVFRKADDKIHYKFKEIYVPTITGQDNITWLSPKSFYNKYKLKCFKEQLKKSGDDYARVWEKQSNFKKLITDDKLDEYIDFYYDRLKNSEIRRRKC